MNYFGTLMAWMNGWLNHVALPGMVKFAAGLIHDELPVAEAMVASVIESIPQDLAASKPLVALSAVAQAAADAAEKAGVKVGVNSLVVASTNAVQALAGQTPTTQVDASSAMNGADQEAEAAIAKINAERDAKKKALQQAADEAAAALKAKVSN